MHFSSNSSKTKWSELLLWKKNHEKSCANPDCMVEDRVYILACKSCQKRPVPQRRVLTNCLSHTHWSSSRRRKKEKNDKAKEVCWCTINHEVKVIPKLIMHWYTDANKKHLIINTFNLTIQSTLNKQQWLQVTKNKLGFVFSSEVIMN